MWSETVSVPSKKYRDADCLQDIIDNIVQVERYIEGVDRDTLRNDDLRYDAVERCLERICEVAFRLGDRAGELLPEQPWRAIRGGWATGYAMATIKSILISMERRFSTVAKS